MKRNNKERDVHMNEEKHYCPECQVGVIRRDGSTYYTWIENELIIVPNFPCWVCDVCGHREWDQSAVFNLGMILSPSAGTSAFDRVRPPSGAAGKAGNHKAKPRQAR